MTAIPFTKAHGARNDFLLTWAAQAPSGDLPEMARRITDRHTGVGADGWLLVEPAKAGNTDADGSIRLFNADGSEAEISGNGTRCAAAFLLDGGLGASQVRIRTGAGIKHLRLLSREGLHFEFEMNMGRPEWTDKQLRFQLPLSGGTREVALIRPGNPQCAVFVEGFDFDWRAMGAEIERHPVFPNRTNVSFVRSVDPHTIEVRFFERGVGETMSSGTGSTGAAAAAILRGVAQSPVQVVTPAGTLPVRWDNDIFLAGPAEIIGRGEFYL